MVAVVGPMGIKPKGVSPRSIVIPLRTPMRVILAVLSFFVFVLMIITSDPVRFDTSRYFVLCI